MSYFPASKTTRKPLQKYNPGFLDEENLESLKMCMSEELWDISKNFTQTDEALGDTFERVDKAEIEIENAKGKIEEVWYLSVEADKVLAARIEQLSADIETEDGKLSSLITDERYARVTADEALAAHIETLRAEVEAGDLLLSSQIKETNLVISNLESTMAQNKTELESSITSSSSSARDELEAAKKALEEALANGDYELAEALKKEIERLQGIIDANKIEFNSKLSIVNETMADLEKTMATNKTELESSISNSNNSAKDELDKAKKALEEAIANGDDEAAEALRKEIARLQGIIDANKADIESKLKITNQTVATLENTMAQNKTELESKINNSSSTAVDQAVAQAKKDLDATKKLLENAIASGDNAAANDLFKEVNRLLGIINTNKDSADAGINQAGKDLLAAKKALETAIANGDTAQAQELIKEINRLLGIINNNKADIESKLSVTNQTVANLDRTTASQITNLQSSFNGQISTVNQTLKTHADKLGNLSASWGVSVDANGTIGGIELVTDSATKRSEFKVRADRFSFTDAYGGKSGGFSSANGVTTFSGSINVADQGGNVGMKITNQQLVVYDEAGRVRVVVGRIG